MDDARFDDGWYGYVDVNSDALLSKHEYWRHRPPSTRPGACSAGLMRCRQVPRDALAWIPALRSPTSESFDYKQAPKLAIIAGRLGVPWVRQPDADELRALRRYDRQ